MVRIEEIVHIIPLGHEIDRAVKPFEHYKANRVHLLAVTDTFEKYSRKMIEQQKHYLNVVKERLTKLGIEVQIRNIDMFDFLEAVRHISNIAVAEKNRGSVVYVNISSAGRLTSAAATLAAMAHQLKPYYVSAERYSETKEEKDLHGLSICEDPPKIQLLETFPLQLPDEDCIKVLVKLYKEKKGMTTTEIAEYLAEQKVEGFEKCSPWRRLPRDQRFNPLMKLNKRILQKLEKSGYITRERKGRYNTIKITSGGVAVAYISGLVQ